MTIGMTVIIVGLVFLLQNMGYLSRDFWGIVWPALLIFWGFSIILKKRDFFPRCCFPFREKRASD